MRKIWQMILTEPAVAIGIPIVGFAVAAGIWSIDWLAFAAAFTAALGTLFVRRNVAPINNGSTVPMSSTPPHVAGQ